jgi:hypothetical protein
MFETVLQPVRQLAARRISSEAADILDLSAQQHWNARVLGRAPIPRSPIRARDWLFVPLEVDGSAIPRRALNRVQAMYEAGIRPQGFVIIHEAPPYLPAGTGETQQSTEPTVSQSSTAATSLTAGLVAAALLLIVMPLAAAVVIGALITLAAAVFVPVAAVGIATAVLVDPMLIAVTEDGYWIVIDEWWV